jgi:signal transduction histidine kinase
MDSLARSDVFFMVTTAAIIIVAILLVGVLIYVLKMVRDARAITKSFRDETKKIISDVEVIRKAVTRDVQKVREVTGSVVKEAANAAKRKFTSHNNENNGEEEKK